MADVVTALALLANAAVTCLDGVLWIAEALGDVTRLQARRQAQREAGQCILKWRSGARSSAFDISPR